MWLSVMMLSRKRNNSSLFFTITHNSIFFKGIGKFIISVRAMSAAALAAVTALEMVLLCKTAVSVLGQVVITFLYGNYFFHDLKIQRYHKSWIVMGRIICLELILTNNGFLLAYHYRLLGV